MTNNRRFMVFSLVIAGFCLVRVVSVSAANRDDEDVEVYSSVEQGTPESGDHRSSEEERNEIRLSRPDEAASRIVEEEGYDLVPGAERLHRRESEEIIISVPRRVGRKIASDAEAPVTPEEHYVEAKSARSGASIETPQPTKGALKAAPLAAEPIEPKSFTAADEKVRAENLPRETISAARASEQRPQLGLHSEPAPVTSIEPPMPPSASGGRVGVQEISLIVSDFGYFPNKLFVTQNVPVKIYLITPSKVTMCFMLDTWNLKKGVTPGRVDEITFTPDQPGDHRFYCPVKSIEGTLTVREAPTATPASRRVAAEEETLTAGRGNTPKRASELRQLIEE